MQRPCFTFFARKHPPTGPAQADRCSHMCLLSGQEANDAALPESATLWNRLHRDFFLVNRACGACGSTWKPERPWFPTDGRSVGCAEPSAGPCTAGPGSGSTPHPRRWARWERGGLFMSQGGRGHFERVLGAFPGSSSRERPAAELRPLAPPVLPQ